MPCPNCSCCEVAYFCTACSEVLCERCWMEHNEDVPCHVGSYDDEAVHAD